MTDKKAVSGPPGRPGHNAVFMGGAKVMDFKGTLLRLWKMTKGSRKGLFAVLSLPCLMSVSAMLGPLFIGRIINGINGGNSVNMLILALILIYAGDWLIRLAYVFITAFVSQKLVFIIRKELFAAVKNLPVSFFDSVSTGDIMSRLTNDIDNISTIISESMGQLMMLVFTVAGVLGMMLWLDFRLTLAVLAAIPLVFILTRVVVGRTRVLFRRQQIVLGRMGGHIEESVSGLALVKAFGMEKQAEEKFEDLNGELAHVGTSALIWSGYLMPVMNVINNLSFIFVSVAGGVMAAKGMVSVGVVSSFLLYSRQFTRPVNEIAAIFNVFQTAVAGAERVMEIFDEVPEPPDRPGAVSVKNASGNIIFDGVSFEYSPGVPVLKNMSFSVKAGEKIALVGPTGAGKTTIINLLTRFYDVTEGRILLDGIDLRDYRLKDLRACFGVVLQDTALFNMSVADNIRYGREDASDEEVADAAKAAGAHDFIERTDGGYYSVIGAEDSDMSQGERQLISIARALLAGASILILDEATSSVDTRTEKRIQSALKSLTRGRTSFIIAHRLSTIRDADRIILINDGRIAEEGTHEELMALGGIYALMYKTQSGSL